jgi:hypothetical protein
VVAIAAAAVLVAVGCLTPAGWWSEDEP